MTERNNCGPAMVWDYIHAMRLFAIDYIRGEVSTDGNPDGQQFHREADGTIEDDWHQWDNYTDINFWIDELDVHEYAGMSDVRVVERTDRYQVATAYLHPTGDNEQKFECDDNLDDRCRIELYRERI